MVRRKTPVDSSCPVARALDVVGDRWSLLIVRDVFDGMRRFGELQKSLGVARNILADRLRTLVDTDILQVAPASDGTAYQEYVLTPKGQGLFVVMVGLRQWGEDHLFNADEPHSLLVERKSGKPIRKIEVRDHSGKFLDAPQTAVRKLPGHAGGK
jgi:DNA-binding HxlR family transcriptional regulator